MTKLIVKNFGVLKDIDINLNKTNLFIGENGAGKSVLAKLITIVTTMILTEDEIFKKFKDYNIDFISDDTIIKLIGKEDTIFELKNKKIKLMPSTVRLAELYPILEPVIKLEKNKTEQDKGLLEIETQFNQFVSQYIPAERNLISIFNNSLSNFIVNDMPLPKTLLEFSAQYNKARQEIQQLDLLDIKFETDGKKDKIYYNRTEFLSLEHSSSGIQAAVPMCLAVKYFNTKHDHIIIEEPELNLFPKAQVDIVRFIIENSDNNLYLMTHSPYILSALNSSILAYKISKKSKTQKQKADKIIPASQQIDPSEFGAYLIENGTAIDIVSKRGLINENSISKCSEDIDDEFYSLMDIYGEIK